MFVSNVKWEKVKNYPFQLLLGKQTLHYINLSY